ncbi:MAG: radical SAM/SPASM domain-containing protein [Acidimicrobiales bacterium]
MFFNIDFEVTNRCNASCDFCPRDATPHQGLMSEEVFDRALANLTVFRDRVNEQLPEWGIQVFLCGLGEPLLNKRIGDYVEKTKRAGFTCGLASNGALLDERRSNAILDAGLDSIAINVSEIDDEYEAIYKLPFEKTRNNVVRFAEMADGRCDVSMVIVDHRDDLGHVRKMRKYWAQYGLTDTIRYDIMNRGGALYVDTMQFDELPEAAEARQLLADRGVSEPLCGAPFVLPFVGYDGQYYLCCSDWTKKAPLGSVFDESFVSTLDRKLDYVLTRDPVCKHCNHDPINKVAEKLIAVRSGAATADDLEALLTELTTGNNDINTLISGLRQLAEPSEMAPARRRIPISIE